jgi:hypothetical protein
VIGTRTEECIRAGVMFGAADAIDGIVRRIKKEWPTPRVPKVIATGGHAEQIAPLCQEIDVVAPFLTLLGLRMAYSLITAASLPPDAGHTATPAPATTSPRQRPAAATTAHTTEPTSRAVTPPAGATARTARRSAPGGRPGT